MQHPKDVKGSDRPLPRNDGKFVLDGKRVEFSDYGGSSDKPKSLLSIPVGQRYTTILGRLNNIEGDLGHIEADVNDLGDLWCDSNTSINNRLDYIESTIEDIEYAVAKETLALSKIEERIAIMQEKIDGID